MIPSIAMYQLTIKLTVSHLLIHSSISDNSISQKSLVCTEFNSQTVLFDSEIGSYQVPLLRVREDLVAMSMNSYSIFSKALRLEGHHQMVLYHIRTLSEEVLPLCKTEFGLFYSHSPLCWL